MRGFVYKTWLMCWGFSEFVGLEVQPLFEKGIMEELLGFWQISCGSDAAS